MITSTSWIMNPALRTSMAAPLIQGPAAGPRTIEFFSVTLFALMMTLPWTSRPLTTCPVVENVGYP